MATPTRTGIKAHKTKWLGRSRIQHFPNINAHALIDNLEFVNQRNIYGAKDILGKFCCLCRACI